MTGVMDEPVYAPAPGGQVAGRSRGEAQPPPAPVTDDVNARFLQFLIPAAATIASTFGSQIGGAVGGLFGGAKTGEEIGGAVGDVLGKFGGGLNLGGLFGRSILPPDLLGGWNPAKDGIISQPVDLTGPLVQQCCLQCLGKITPDLATMLKTIKPNMPPADSDGSRGAAEIGAVERFWPEIASFLTQQVATHLPAIMKTVTTAVTPLIGSRDSGQFTPIITGTEAHTRWFLPVLTSVLTAVQQNLPKLFDVLDGESRAARDIGITWTDLSTYGRFWDNDFVRVISQDDLGDPGRVGLVLELAPHLSWAKEIQVRDDNGALVARLHVQDQRKWDEAELQADQILTNGSLLLAKAKMFGIMTGMYVLPTAGLDALRGKRTHVRWMAD